MGGLEGFLGPFNIFHAFKNCTFRTLEGPVTGWAAPSAFGKAQ